MSIAIAICDGNPHRGTDAQIEPTKTNCGEEIGCAAHIGRPPRPARRLELRDFDAPGATSGFH
jgi:hypothetical protein